MQPPSSAGKISKGAFRDEIPYVFQRLNMARKLETYDTFYLPNRLLGVFRPRLLAVSGHRGQNRESEHKTGMWQSLTRGLNAPMRLNQEQATPFSCHKTEYMTIWNTWCETEGRAEVEK